MFNVISVLHQNIMYKISSIFYLFIAILAFFHWILQPMHVFGTSSKKVFGAWGVYENRISMKTKKNKKKTGFWNFIFRFNTTSTLGVSFFWIKSVNHKSKFNYKVIFWFFKLLIDMLFTFDNNVSLEWVRCGKEFNCYTSLIFNVLLQNNFQFCNLVSFQR